jgi:hypothetical protein
MSDMLDDMPDDNLRKKLKGYSENPDDNLWEKIQSGMPRPEVSLGVKLSNYSEQPDDVVWKGIKRTLWVERSFVWIDRAGQLASLAALFLLLTIGAPWGKIYTVEELSASSKKSVEQQTIEPDKEEEVQLNKSVDTNNPQTKGTGQVSQEHLAKENSHLPKTKNVKGNYNAGFESSSSVSGNLSIEKNYDSYSVDGLNAMPQERFDRQTLVNPSQENQKLKVVSDLNSTSELTANNPDGSSAEVDTTTKINTYLEMVAKPENENVTVPAKEEKKKTKRAKGFYVLVMPTFGYQKIEPVKTDNILIESIQKVSAFSTNRLGIRAEFGIEKPVSPRLSAHVGVLYFQRKQTIAYSYRDTDKIIIEHSIEDSLVYTISTQKENATFEYELKNIGVIAGLNYTLKSKRFIHKFGVAAEVQRGLKPVNKEVNTGQRTYLFGDAYYRVIYPVSRRLDFMFQPTINYSLQLDQRLSAPFYVKPYGLGLNVGAYFHF